MRKNLLLALLLFYVHVSIGQKSLSPGVWDNTSFGWPQNTVITSSSVVEVIHPKSLVNRDINATQVLRDKFYNTTNFPLLSNKGIFISSDGKFTFGSKTSLQKVNTPISSITSSRQGVNSTNNQTIASGNDIAGLFDGNILNNAFRFSGSQKVRDAIVFRLNLAYPQRIAALELIVSSGFSNWNNGTQLILQASLNGSTWVDLNNPSSSSPSSGRVIFSATKNLDFYKFYRVYGHSTSNTNTDLPSGTSFQFIELQLYSDEVQFSSLISNASKSSPTVDLQTNNDLVDQGIFSGGFLQALPYDDFGSLKFYGSGPIFGAGAFYNPILGAVQQVNSFSSGQQTVSLNQVASNYDVQSYPFTASILADPNNDISDVEHDLILFASANTSAASIPIARFTSGISNFEGYVGSFYGDIVVESGATLIVGPTECKYCDPNDPSYPKDASGITARKAECLTAAWAKCRENRFRQDAGSKVTIKRGGRIIVYGNYYNAASKDYPLTIDGALYIVGNLLLEANTNITSSDPNFTSSDIYATGQFDAVNGESVGSINFYGTKSFNECLVSPCTASQNLCGWYLRSNTAGTVPYCSGKVLSAILEKNGSLTASQFPTYAWEKYDAVNGVWITVASTAQGNNPPALSLNETPPVNGALYYRLKGQFTSQGTTCTSYTSIVQVIGSTAIGWKGGNSGVVSTDRDWNVAANWCSNTVPKSTDDVIIDYVGVNQPIISGPANARSILVKTGLASNAINVLDNRSTLNIYGDFLFETFSKLTSSASSTINFAGAGTQSISHLESSSVINLLEFNNVTVNSGAVVLAPPVSSTPLQISGNLTVNGQFKPGATTTSSVIFKGGNTTISVGASAVCELNQVKIDKGSASSTLTIQSGRVVLTGVLNFSSVGNLAVNNLTNLLNASLILKSVDKDNAFNAGIGEIPVGGSVTGNITFERFMAPAGGIQFRYIGSPIQPPYPTLANKVPSALLYRYRWFPDPLKQPDLGSYSPVFNLTTPLETGVGYAVYYNDANTKWALTGKINQGNIRLICPDGVNESGCVFTKAKQGWYLLSNPYPHPIYWGDNSSLSFPAQAGLNVTTDFQFGSGWDTYRLNNGIPLPLATDPTFDIDGGLTGGFMVGKGISQLISIMDNSTIDATSNRKLRLFALNGLRQISFELEPFAGWYGAKDLYTDADFQATRRISQGMIAPGQSFWVYSYGKKIADVTRPAPENTVDLNQSSYLIITERAKTTKGNTGNFYRQAVPEVKSENTSSSRIESSKYLMEITVRQDSLQDFTYVRLLPSEKLSRPLEAQFMPKFPTMDLDIFTTHLKTATPSLYSEHVLNSDEQRIFLSFRNLKKGSFSISFDWGDSFVFSDRLFLNDLKTGHSHPIVRGQYVDFFSDGLIESKEDRYFISGKPIQSNEYSPIILSVFPNPTVDKITVSSNRLLPIKTPFRIINSQGIEIFSGSFEENEEIDIQSLPAGVYFISIYIDEMPHPVKFIKSR